MFWVDVISRIAHVTTAITLMGGSIFLLFVLIPAISGLSEDVRVSLAQSVNGRWKKFVHGGIALFLLTGFYNYFRAMPNHQGDGQYHMILGIKMLTAFVVFFIASALVGRSAGLSKMRENRTFWLTILLMLSMTIVAISGFLKIRGNPNASAVEVPTAAAAESPAL